MAFPLFLLPVLTSLTIIAAFAIRLSILLFEAGKSIRSVSFLSFWLAVSEHHVDPFLPYIRFAILESLGRVLHLM